MRWPAEVLTSAECAELDPDDVTPSETKSTTMQQSSTRGRPSPGAASWSGKRQLELLEQRQHAVDSQWGTRPAPE